MNWLKKFFGIHECDFTGRISYWALIKGKAEEVNFNSGMKMQKCIHCNTWIPVEDEKQMTSEYVRGYEAGAKWASDMVLKECAKNNNPFTYGNKVQ